MARRIKLQGLLEELLGSSNVYYKSPESKKMEYPAIKYSLDNINKKSANDTVYLLNKRYEIIVISKKPDHPVINKLLQLPMCSYERQYVSDNLYHDVLTLYY